MNSQCLIEQKKSDGDTHHHPWDCVYAATEPDAMIERANLSVFADFDQAQTHVQRMLAPFCTYTTFCLSTSWNKVNRVATLTVLLWQADTCQGQVFPSLSISFGLLGGIMWTRKPASETAMSHAMSQATTEPPTTLSRQELFSSLFDLFLSTVPMTDNNNNTLLLQQVTIESVVPLSHALTRHGIAKLAFGELPPHVKRHAMSLACLAHVCAHVLRHSNCIMTHMDVGELVQAAVVVPIMSAIEHMWQALLPQHNDKDNKHTTTVHALNVQTHRRIYTWNRNVKCRHDNNHTSAGLLLLSWMTRVMKHQHFKCLDLSGHNLSSLDTNDGTSAVVKDFMAAVHQSGLETLSLRDTNLDEQALLHVIHALDNSKSTLRSLDISHNAFTCNVMRALTTALQRNCTLERLTIEHCSIDLEMVTILAKGLGTFSGLLYLGLNGNPFCFEPLQVSNNDKSDNNWLLGTDAFNAILACRTDLVSVGAVRLVDALWTASRHSSFLHAIDMGDGNQYFGMVCCTSPCYTLHLTASQKAILQSRLSQNLQAYREYRRVRLRQAVVYIVGLIMSKQANEN